MGILGSLGRFIVDTVSDVITDGIEEAKQQEEARKERKEELKWASYGFLVDIIEDSENFSALDISIAKELISMRNEFTESIIQSQELLYDLDDNQLFSIYEKYCKSYFGNDAYQKVKLFFINEINTRQMLLNKIQNQYIEQYSDSDMEALIDGSANEHGSYNYFESKIMKQLIDNRNEYVYQHTQPSLLENLKNSELVDCIVDIKELGPEYFGESYTSLIDVLLNELYNNRSYLVDKVLSCIDESEYLDDYNDYSTQQLQAILLSDEKHFDRIDKQIISQIIKQRNQ